MDMYDASNPKVAEAKAKAPKLPRSLEAALDALEASKELRAALGDEVIDAYLKLRRQQCTEYAAQVSAWELKTYLDV